MAHWLAVAVRLFSRSNTRAGASSHLRTDSAFVAVRIGRVILVFRIRHILITGSSGVSSRQHSRRSSELYRQLQRSHLVCSNCFRLVVADKVEPSSWRDSLDDVLTPVYLHGEGAERPGQYKSSYPSCDECGVASVMDTVRPLTKAELIKRLLNLRETLEALSLSYDTQTLFQAAWERKTTPEYAGRDDETIGLALKAALLDDVDSQQLSLRQRLRD